MEESQTKGGINVLPKAWQVGKSGDVSKEVFTPKLQKRMRKPRGEEEPWKI
jgi:hypothetical protein